MSITDPIIGSQLGDYRILALLGHGGMARVYRGYDEKLDRYAAVKVIDARQSVEPSEEYRKRFQREARAIARLNHPNIVSIYQFGEDGPLYYMAMAFIEGRDLGQILAGCQRTGRQLPYQDVLRLTRDIASALDHAHAGGVIHRDVKPSNIMVTPDGRGILTDFGLALSVPEGSIGNTFGSAHYIAPEQALASSAAVPQSDFYSLGIVLYLMLTGRVPFDDPSAMAVVLQHLNDPPPPPRSVNPDIPPQIEAVLLRLLEKEPARRFPDGRALVEALEAAFSAAGVVAVDRPSGQGRAAAPAARHETTPASVQRLEARRTGASGRIGTRPRSRRRWALVAALLLSLVLAFAGGVALVLRDSQQPETLAGDSLPDATLPGTSVAWTMGETPATAASSAATREASPEPAQEDADEAEQTPAPATRTPVPSRTATEMATATPDASPTPAANDVIDLRFDDVTLVIYNPTDHAVDISDLQFVQTTENGQVGFRSSLWYSDALLQPKACVQVWTNHYTELPPPDYCELRQAWRSVSFLRWFWLSDDPDASFEVLRDDRVLARCAIQAGVCSLPIG